jgi:LuxR family transcriptional regulator, maltose regulon positive regulatory protein
MLQMWKKNETEFYFERPRLNNLFMKAVNYPLVIVCAGAGYGKTSAVHNFVLKYDATTVWVQVSERDNVEARFWESYIHSVAQLNQSYAKALDKLGFPNTREKINSFLALQLKYVDKRPQIVVMDDFHNINAPSIIRFVEECTFFKQPPGTAIILVSRSPTQINTAGMIYKNQIFNISENDLRFTEDELSQYFRHRDISVKSEDLREIMRDTGGWAFAINLIARSYQKAPGYAGYIRDAIFLLI